MDSAAQLLAQLWDLTGGVLFNPSHFLSVFPLLVAFIIALIVVLIRLTRKNPNRVPSVRRVMAMMFPKRVFLHGSARLDYAVFVINQVVLFVITISAMVSPALISQALIGIAGIAGFEPAQNEITLTQRILYSVYLVLLWDFGASYAHYLKHKVPVLWELHKVHHSAEVMTPITALRRHPLEAIFGALVTSVVLGLGIAIWVFLFGMNVMPINLFGMLFGIWLWRVAGYNLRHSHIWISYGDFWNRIFISPAQHQVHHSKSPEHYDMNFGHIFSFWDRMFGTLYLPKFEERMTFGIDDDEMPEYRSLFGLYVTPLIKIWRRLRKPPIGKQTPAE